MSKFVTDVEVVVEGEVYLPLSSISAGGFFLHKGSICMLMSDADGVFQTMDLEEHPVAVISRGSLPTFICLHEKTNVIPLKKVTLGVST